MAAPNYPASGSGSLPTFAAFARQKKLVDALSVRFLRAALSISHLRRKSAIRPYYQNMHVAASVEMGSLPPFAAESTKVRFAANHQFFN